MVACGETPAVPFGGYVANVADIRADGVRGAPIQVRSLAAIDVSFVLREAADLDWSNDDSRASDASMEAVKRRLLHERFAARPRNRLLRAVLIEMNYHLLIGGDVYRTGPDVRAIPGYGDVVGARWY